MRGPTRRTLTSAAVNWFSDSRSRPGRRKFTQPRKTTRPFPGNCRLTGMEESLIRGVRSTVPGDGSLGPVRDDGDCMRREWNRQSLCLVLLLVAEAIQGVTPDIASVVSPRLYLMAEAILARGEFSSAQLRDGRRVFDRTERAPAPVGSLPFQGGDDEEADEVCLASEPRSSPARARAKPDSRGARHISSDRGRRPVRSNRSIDPSQAVSFPCAGALSHSCCRLTC